jgi:PAS domain S-box-containing protein
MSPQKKSAARPAGKKVTRKVLPTISTKKPAKKSSGTVKKKTSPPLQDMIDAVGAGFYTLKEGKFVSVSPLYEKMTGYPASELVGSHLLDYIHPDDREMVRKKKLKKLRAASSEPFEYRFIRKDGETAWFMEMSGPAARDEAAGLIGSVMDVTGLKPSSDHYALQQDRYRAVLQEMGESYYETDLQGNLTFVNDRLARTLGYSRKELLGMHYRGYCDGRTAKKMATLSTRIYKTDKPFTCFEGTYLRKDGAARHAEISGALMRDALEAPFGVRFMSRDITQRREMEEALRKSEERYRTILEEIKEGYGELDLKGNWTFANNAAAESIGYKPEELMGMSFRQVTDEPTAEKMAGLFDDLCRTGKPFKGEEALFISRTDIKLIHEISGALMRDEKKKPTGFRLLSRDITSRKWAEEALLQSEAKYVSIIESIDAAFFETDLTGVITFANDKACRDLGYTRDELLRMSNTQLQDEEHARKTYDAFIRVYKTGRTVKDFHYQVLRKDGTKADYELSISLIRNASGKPIGFRALSFDVTMKKRAEELIRKSEQSLREYSEKLERSVKERTAELEKAKIAAEAASRAKSDFMAGISHEFQTPLNAVIGFSKVLQDRMFGELNEKQEEFIRYIADAGKSLSRIITEILEVSRVSSGGADLNLSFVPLSGLLDKAGRMLVDLIKEKNHTFTLKIEPDADIHLEADEQKITQVIFHLFSNAVKYTAPGGKIDVRAFLAGDSASGRDGVSISVEDTGMGIKAEDIPRLFQTFGTLASPYTRSDEGIGMGLALARQLVEMHGGTIHVESEFGRGSCFTVFLPLRQKRQE